MPSVPDCSKALASRRSLDRLAGAGVDGTGIQAGEDRLAHDVWDEEEDNLMLLGLLGLSGEEVFEEGEFTKTRGSVRGVVVLRSDEAGENAGFTLFKLDDLLADVLADDGLRDTTDGDASPVARRPRSSS